MIHCWRPENHKHGDSTASVSIWTARNKIKCFVCPVPAMSVVDLTISVLSTDIHGAIRWLDENFKLEYIPKGKHLEPRTKEQPFQVGHEQPLDLLVSSGIWAGLAAQTQRIVPVLLKFAKKIDRDRWRTDMSYTGLMRYSGVRSRNSISTAINQLREIGWLVVEQIPSSNGPLKIVNSYLITPYSDDLMELANSMALQVKQEIAVEKRIRKEQYRARQEALDAAKKATSGELAGIQPIPQSNAYKV